MYKTLSIDGKEYKIEFTIEASLYDEVITRTISLMESLTSASSEKDMKSIIGSMSDIPKTALVMFYAGLLEYHGADGDGSVTSMEDAKRLVKLYFKEHAEDETGNFYGLMNMLIEQMGEDGFFKQIGLAQASETVVNLQDHKKKKTAPSKN